MSTARKQSPVPTTKPKVKQPRKLLRRQASLAAEGHVFLSYSRDDRKYVIKLAEWLEGHGVNVWFDNDIDRGVKWKAEIYRHLDTATVVLAVMSKSARSSNWVIREIKRANLRKIPIFPLLLDPDGIVDLLAELQFENVAGGQMPGLRICQKLPGFLVSEMDIVDDLTAEQIDVARRMVSAMGGGVGPNSKMPAVAALQAELFRVGLDPGRIDGLYEEKTKSAVLEFQRRRSPGFKADGNLGSITWMILANSSLGDLAPPTLSRKEQRGTSPSTLNHQTLIRPPVVKRARR